MRDVFAIAHTQGLKFSSPLWNTILSKDLKDGISKDIEEFVDQGKLLVPEAGALGPCVDQKRGLVGKLVPSFDRDLTYSSGRITGLKKDSPGFQAGLREGQQLLDRQVSDPQIRPARYKIRDRRGVRWIEFLAVGENARMTSYYILNEKEFTRNPKHCLA